MRVVRRTACRGRPAEVGDRDGQFAVASRVDRRQHCPDRCDQDASYAGRLEPPDEIVNGQIDLGALTAEFLALGLDPYPRKPGVDFNYRDPADEKDSPFAALSKLKGGK